MSHEQMSHEQMSYEQMSHEQMSHELEKSEAAGTVYTTPAFPRSTRGCLHSLY